MANRICVYLYAWLMDSRAQLIKDAIDGVAQIDDPQERAKVIGEALDILKEANAALSKLRRQDIQALRAAGLSYRQIGPAIGVHYTRVKQIESGQPTGATARARAERKDSDGPA